MPANIGDMTAATHCKACICPATLLTLWAYRRIYLERLLLRATRWSIVSRNHVGRHTVALDIRIGQIGFFLRLDAKHHHTLSAHPITCLVKRSTCSVSSLPNDPPLIKLVDISQPEDLSP